MNGNNSLSLVINNSLSPELVISDKASDLHSLTNHTSHTQKRKSPPLCRMHTKPQMDIG